MNARHSAHILLLGSLALSSPAFADFIGDSKASLSMRNFYMNRDFRQPGAVQSKSEEWAQGFILNVESGYTEGVVGVGVDALGLLGLKLDSSPDRSGGTSLLPRSPESHRADDSYSHLGATAKLRASKSTLKVGTQLPTSPLVVINDTRLLPQTFEGAWLNSRELDGLSLDAGQLWQVRQRDGSNNEDMSIARGAPGLTSDRFDFVGGDYKWNSALNTGYSFGKLEDIYKQHVLTLGYNLPLTPEQSLRTDLRWADSSADGSASQVDNRALGAMFTYSYRAHRFGAYYQRLSGRTGYAYLAGSNPYLVNLVQIGDFGNADERSWQLRYDYDFAALGVPGLSFMTRYVNGDNVDAPNIGGEGKEWERNTDIAYVLQSGPLRGVKLHFRNASARSNFGNDIDENRFIVSYSLALW
ncbi:Porin-like protein NicP [compost metagenome]